MSNNREIKELIKKEAPQIGADFSDIDNSDAAIQKRKNSPAKKATKQDVQKVVQAMLAIPVLADERELQKAIYGKKAAANMKEDFKTSVVKLSALQLLTVSMMSQARKGNVGAMNLLLDRAYGSVKQKTEIEMTVSHTRYISDDQLEEAIKDVEAEYQEAIKASSEAIPYEQVKTD